MLTAEQRLPKNKKTLVIKNEGFYFQFTESGLGKNCL
jgi:hypothetical protein